MSLGTKINIVLLATIGTVLSLAFWVIFAVESATIKNQIVNDANTSTDILHRNAERMLTQTKEAQLRLQESVDSLSTAGVGFINVVDVRGERIAATDRALVGTKSSLGSMEIIKQVLAIGETLEIQNDQKTAYALRRYLPIREEVKDKKSPTVGVVEIEVITQTKTKEDIANGKKLLDTVSAGVTQNVRSVILMRNENLEAMEYLTNAAGKYGFFHDFYIIDDKVNIVANASGDLDEFDHDLPEHKSIREDVLSGKTKGAKYERIDDEQDVIVQITPIIFTFASGKTQIIGATESHLLVAAYKNKVTAMKIRLIEIAIAVILVLMLVLAAVFRRTVVIPLRKFSAVAERVSAGDLNQTINYSSRDEIGRFATVFNTMLANLRELDQMKSDFLSVAAHQLRTPLAGVKWVLKLLIEEDLGSLTDDQRGMLKRGFETNEKMIQLVNDLLSVSRIENGKYKYAFEKDDIMRVIKILAQNSEPIAKEHGLYIHLNASHPVPTFSFDAEKILLALQNLVDNAIKYTLPGGHVTISVEQKGDYVEIKIKDSGVGIPKESIPKLFSKFFRAPNVIYLQTDGSGLGLFIVKSIIIQHGGQIWVDSEEGKGTTFTVVLPLLEELLPKEGEVRLFEDTSKKGAVI